MAKNVRLVNCMGISPLSLFEERSNDSSANKFAKDDGICPIRLLWERLSSWRNLSLPSSSGISPWNSLLDKSIVVKMVRIFSTSISNPLLLPLLNLDNKLQLDIREDNIHPNIVVQVYLHRYSSCLSCFQNNFLVKGQ